MSTENFYCSCCLRTQAFVANERGYQCTRCRKLLVSSEPARPRRLRGQSAPAARVALAS